MKDKVCGVYLITNNLNGMSYVGQSKNCWDRWRIHKSPSTNKTYIDKTIKEFGKENFTFKIEKECLPEELDYYERETIKKYNTLYPNGYNRDTGGKKNNIRCQESIDIWLSSCEGKFHANSGSFKKGQIPWNKGKVSLFKGIPRTEEIKQKMRDAQKGIPKSKQKWITPQGEVREMNVSHATQWHPDWIKIEE